MASTGTIAPQNPTGRLAVLHRLRPPTPSRRAPSLPAIRVLVADGQALVRAALRVLLDADPRITVVAEASTGLEALALARQVRPDVAMIDAALPGFDAGEARSQMLSESGVAVLLLSASEDDERMLSALRAGARGVLLKDTEPAQLVHAVELLAAGEALLSPGLTRRLIAELASRPEPADASPELLDELTAREREVVGLVALGLSNGEIAEQLVISPATAKTHVSRAMLKLQVRDRAKLVVLAYKAGLVLPRSNNAASHVGQPLAMAT
jgi:DNA-binding NarL/FixJ family response regulator